MSANRSRMELHIDVFEERGQVAMVLPQLSPSELVKAILLEFRELAYLSDRPTDYYLVRAKDGSPLDETSQLDAQLRSQERLVLVEKSSEPPEGTHPPSHHIYLREQRTGQVHKLHWLPAIIGRPDTGQPRNDWVAVNLQHLETGLRVSRRHAQITQEEGQFYIESISNNPTALINQAGEIKPVSSTKEPLEEGDIIHLKRSDISLQVILRPDQGS
jgi:hypothetical protein